MIKIKLTYPYSWPIIKQTPGRSGVWGDCQFFINQDIPECDFWVVFDGLEKKEKTKCPSQNTLLVTAEPPSVKTYNASFLNQFAAVLTSHDLDHENVIQLQQGLNWMVGGTFIKEKKTWEKQHTKDFDELSSIKRYEKTKLLSLVSSNKTLTPGHRKRLAFIHALKDHFGDELDVYGVGFNEVGDKWDAIAPYKYHVAIENSVYKNYWTEKLSDSFLGGAFPVYYGCPNVHDYFSTRSLGQIDIDNIPQSISAIEEMIRNDVYSQRLKDILEAKELILNKYNLLAVISDYCARQLSETPAVTKIISPENDFLQNGYWKKLKSLAFRR